MSITLMAYPMAFLINPQDAKNEKLQMASEVLNSSTQCDFSQNLQSIRVLTNILFDELKPLMTQVDCTQIRPNTYYLPTGIKVEWFNRGKYAVAEISGSCGADNMQMFGENLFQQLDGLSGRNVRLIESNEYFYYIYETSYTSAKEIYDNLKTQNATQIFMTAENEIIATINDQNVKYYRYPNNENYMLEVEQQVRILNIGLRNSSDGRNISYGLTNLRIQTNIKPEELKGLLKEANYLFYEANRQTPLKNTNATLNWIIKDGRLIAEFSGDNNSAITKEAEIIFRKLNIAAGRDLRLIDDVATTVYTYNTNYADKGVLLNTLIEHGAEELAESGDEISCKLFGMEMVYYKKDGSGGYTLDITQVTNVSECEGLITDLNDEYGLNIQEITYNKIKERLAQENLRLESESVLEDNSIVLTIEV